MKFHLSIATTQIAAWKREFLENAELVFSKEEGLYVHVRHH
jgi:asparagine synthetase A